MGTARVCVEYNFRNVYLLPHKVTLAEWLRRWPAKPLCSARVGSNPTGDENFTCPFFSDAFLFDVDIFVAEITRITVIKKIMSG